MDDGNGVLVITKFNAEFSPTPVMDALPHPKQNGELLRSLRGHLNVQSLQLPKTETEMKIRLTGPEN